MTICRVPARRVTKKVPFAERALAIANPGRWFVLDTPILDLDTQGLFREYRRVTGYWEMR